MKSFNRKLLSLIFRYLLLLIIAIPDFYLIYLIFTPLTLYPAYVFFKIFYNASLNTNVIDIGCASLEIVKACVAGSAYYLLFFLSLSIPEIKLKKRVLMILFSSAVLLLFNWLRIIIIGIMHLNLYSGTIFYHKFFWYAGSTIFVVLIWFLTIKLFRVNKIPVYSDLKFIYSYTNLNKLLENKTSIRK